MYCFGLVLLEFELFVLSSLFRYNVFFCFFSIFYRRWLFSRFCFIYKGLTMSNVLFCILKAFYHQSLSLVIDAKTAHRPFFGTLPSVSISAGVGIRTPVGTKPLGFLDSRSPKPSPFDRSGHTTLCWSTNVCEFSGTPA